MAPTLPYSRSRFLPFSFLIGFISTNENINNVGACVQDTLSWPVKWASRVLSIASHDRYRITVVVSSRRCRSLAVNNHEIHKLVTELGDVGCDLKTEALEDDPFASLHPAEPCYLSAKPYPVRLVPYNFDDSVDYSVQILKHISISCSQHSVHRRDQQRRTLRHDTPG